METDLRVRPYQLKRAFGTERLDRGQRLGEVYTEGGGARAGAAGS